MTENTALAVETVKLNNLPTTKTNVIYFTKKSIQKCLVEFLGQNNKTVTPWLTDGVFECVGEGHIG